MNLNFFLGVNIIFLIQLSGCQSEYDGDSNIIEASSSFVEIHKFDGEGLRLDTVWYGNSRQIRKLRYFRNDTLLNYEELKYNKDGTLFSYCFYNEHGRLIYMCSFDANCGIIDEKGEHIIQVVVNNQHLRIGDTLEVSVLVAKPPKSEYNLYIKSADTHHSVFTQENPCKNIWKKKMTKRGEFLLPIGIDFYHLSNSDTIVGGLDVTIYIE